MIVATLQVGLVIHGAESIKDKRRVVKSVKDRLHREHMASVAETGQLDTMSAARLGIAVCGLDGKYLAQVLDKISDKLRALHDAEVAWTHRELIKVELPEDADAEEDIDAASIADEMMAWVAEDGLAEEPDDAGDRAGGDAR